MLVQSRALVIGVSAAEQGEDASVRRIEDSSECLITFNVMPERGVTEELRIREFRVGPKWIEAEFDRQRKALGVSDDLKEIEGLTTPMLVKLGENGVKTLEDLADCASDDLVGWTERSETGETAKPGFLSGFDISRAQADAMILDARVRAGWIEAPAPEDESQAQEGVAQEGEGV